MSQVLNCKIENHIAIVELNRPSKMNALSRDMFESLVNTGRELRNNKDVRCVVIHGNERAFCAGLDMEMFTNNDGNLTKLRDRTHGLTNLFQETAWVWHDLDMPVIAAIEGVCFGGGLQLACGADMRYVHPEAKMSIMEIKWGLVPDMAGTQLWSRYVKEDLLRELSYTGRIFSGTEAMEYGFATRLTETPLEMAMSIAQEIAGKNPDAIRGNKRLINQQLTSSVATGMLAESLEQEVIIGSKNQIEAVMANFEKREPNFE